MRHGVPLVPTYAFGENALYKTHDFGMSWREWIALKLRVGLPLATGRLGGPFPHAAHHVYALGRPVPTGPPNATPTDAEVVAVLHKWLREAVRRAQGLPASGRCGTRPERHDQKPPVVPLRLDLRHHRSTPHTLSD